MGKQLVTGRLEARTLETQKEDGAAAFSNKKLPRLRDICRSFASNWPLLPQIKGP